MSGDDCRMLLTNAADLARYDQVKRTPCAAEACYSQSGPDSDG